MSRVENDCEDGLRVLVLYDPLLLGLFVSALILALMMNLNCMVGLTS